MAATVVDLLQESVQKFGPRTALLFKPAFRYHRWSYARLWEEAGQVATLLQQRGITKGDRVVIWGPNCPQWVLAFLGCLRAGAIAVPLDMRTSQEFAERVFSKTRPVLAFVSRVTPPAHQELPAPRVYFEEMEQLTHSLPPPRSTEITPQDLVEVMFTSGTTGDPKGVMITHANLVANVEATDQVVPGKPSYRLLSLLPLSHMLEQMGGLLVALHCGASITYPISRQPTVLLRTMRERRVTNLLVVPQVMELFLHGIEREARRQGKEGVFNLLLRVAPYLPLRLRRLLFGSVHRRFGGALEFVVAGGAALDQEVGATWSLLGVKVLQGYGATEASPLISCHTLADPHFDSVGRPVPGVEVKIASEGEVLVRGPNITPGYWEAPEQTAAAFQDGWYKTGDMGYFDAQGFLHLNGRKKDMVVLSNGQNVFPEDIEAVLRKHPAITDSAVVGLPKGAGVEVHAALLLSDPTRGEEVVAWANRQLAEHQRIQGFTLWPQEDFPRTHTLKVKKALILETLVGSSSATSASAAPPQQEEAHGVLERLVAEVGGIAVEEVTEEKALGEELNLDSLGRIELLSAIEEELGVSLDESRISPETTFGQLRELVQSGSSMGQAPAFPRWGMSLWCRTLREALQRALLFPVVWWAYRLQVTGQENLRGVKGPVILAANHHLYLDNGLILKALPLATRRRLAIAANAETFRSPFWRIVNPLLGNGFPFSKEGAVRASLDNLGRILDDGWSVLIYPEGELTMGGPMKPFMGGTGLIAVEGGVAVVPLRLHIKRMGSPGLLPLFRRGEVEVRIGKPMTLPAGMTIPEATRALEEAVGAL